MNDFRGKSFVTNNSVNMLRKVNDFWGKGTVVFFATVQSMKWQWTIFGGNHNVSLKDQKLTVSSPIRQVTNKRHFLHLVENVCIILAYSGKFPSLA